MSRRDDLEHRMDEVRRLLRARHARVSPDDGFAGRVAARAVRDPLSPFAWAFARLLPASAALAALLLVAVLVDANRGTGGSGSATTSATRTASASAREGEFDPLSWVLEGSAR